MAVIAINNLPAFSICTAEGNPAELCLPANTCVRFSCWQTAMGTYISAYLNLLGVLGGAGEKKRWR